MFHGKIYYFLSFLLFGITLVIKLNNLDFECHGSILLFSDKKGMASALNMSHGKMSNLFLSFPLFGFTLVIKLTNFDFEDH